MFWFCEKYYFILRSDNLQIRSTQWLCSVKYLYGEADVAETFPLLEDGWKFLDVLGGVPSHNFRSSSNKSATVFLSLIFHISLLKKNFRI